jgi:NADH:ubiquinone reductase (H+-translocating)
MVAKAKVVILGGGFGGLNAALQMRKGVAGIVLIDRTNHHLFQPLLYQVASAVLSPSDIAYPIRAILRRFKNIVVIMGEAAKIHKEERLVEMRNGRMIQYDYLIVAVGARHSYFGHSEWEKVAPGLKTLDDALLLRERLLMSFELAERAENPAEAEKHLNFVVIGGGPTGVELAGAVAEVAYKTMIRDFRRVDTSKTKVYLIEGADQLLPSYPVDLADRAQRDLEKLGVHVILHEMVTDVTSEGVQVGDRFIPATNVIWAAGNQASPLLKTLEVRLDRQGRVIVESDCTVAGYPELFVIGDAAHLESPDGHLLPGIAPVATQQGRYVGEIIRKKIPKEKRAPFRYHDKGQMATIGKNKAVAMIGRFHLKGYIAWLAWSLIHVAYLIGYRSRIIVMVEWIVQYVTGKRGGRLIQTHLEGE